MSLKALSKKNEVIEFISSVSAFIFYFVAFWYILERHSFHISINKWYFVNNSSFVLSFFVCFPTYTYKNEDEWKFTSAFRVLEIDMQRLQANFLWSSSKHSRPDPIFHKCQKQEWLWIDEMSKTRIIMNWSGHCWNSLCIHIQDKEKLRSSSLKNAPKFFPNCLEWRECFGSVDVIFIHVLKKISQKRS